MSEGEKLSKEQLTLNNTIKKLRTRVKETDEKLKKTDERAKKGEESTTRLEGELETVKVRDSGLESVTRSTFFSRKKSLRNQKPCVASPMKAKKPTMRSSH